MSLACRRRMRDMCPHARPEACCTVRRLSGHPARTGGERSMDEKEALKKAVEMLIGIKKRACHTRLNVEPRDGLVTPSSRCLNSIEGDVEEFLNELAQAAPELAKPWEVTPEFAADNGIDLKPGRR